VAFTGEAFVFVTRLSKI